MEELKTRVGIQIQLLDVPLVGPWEGGRRAGESPYLQQLRSSRSVRWFLLETSGDEVLEGFRPSVWLLQLGRVILGYVVQCTHCIHVEEGGLSLS